MLLALLAVVVVGAAFVQGQARPAGGMVKCFEKWCQSWEYCLEVDRTCQSCVQMCDPTSHNYYSEKDCATHCRDYLKSLKDVEIALLKNRIDSYGRMVTASLTISILTVLLLIVWFIYRWAHRHNITPTTLKRRFFKEPPEPTKTFNPSQEGKKPDLKLEIHPSETHSDHSPVTVTTSISRRPAEDSTLDYAYDNPAMTQTSNPRY